MTNRNLVRIKNSQDFSWPWTATDGLLIVAGVAAAGGGGGAGCLKEGLPVVGEAGRGSHYDDGGNRESGTKPQ